MAATDIAASHVSFTKIREFQIYGPENHAGEDIRFIHGTLTVNVGSGNTAVYTTAAKVPLTNLFDPAHASYLGLDRNHIWTDPHFRIGNGAIFYEAEWDFGSTPRVEIQVLGGNQTYTGSCAVTGATNTYEFAAQTLPTYLIGQLVAIEGFATATNGAVVGRISTGGDNNTLIIDPVSKVTSSDEGATTVTIYPIPSGRDMVSQLSEVKTATDFLVQTLTARVTLFGRRAQ
ncbi:MAG: hypothetical protein IPK26_26335 [Planctomycetes bacterium]|nr:hypothetical protein [Planctomycetota bacterium]